ncbi:MAG: ABC transporter substrate-binding protein [Armatimonadetes bacterium]|nr:ABC transporter substrate-binding protein [Armatimonadota bacterium]
MRRVFMLWIAIAVIAGAPALAQQAIVKVGFVVDVTGGASSLGVPERNTVLLYQDEFGTAQGPAGPVRIQYIITDGESDPTKAFIAAKRLIDEERVAAVVCCTTSPASLAIIETVQAARVPNISLAAAVQIIEPVQQRRWIFKTPQTDRLMIDVITDHMRQRGIRRVAWLGFDDAFGQGGLVEFEKIAPQKQIEIVAKESFARASTDVSTQITRAMGRNPQAFLIWAIPPGANVANRNIRDLGIMLPVYQSHGVANKTFLDLGGATVEGTLLPAGKLLVAEALPDSDKQKPVLLSYLERYEGRYGRGTRNTFGGHALDAMFILKPAIERTLKQGIRPENTGGFRTVLRDQIERGTKELVGITGIFTYTPRDHLGLDRRAAVMIEVRNNNWTAAR